MSKVTLFRLLWIHLLHLPVQFRFGVCKDSLGIYASTGVAGIGAVNDSLTAILPVGVSEYERRQINHILKTCQVLYGPGLVPRKTTKAEANSGQGFVSGMVAQDTGTAISRLARYCTWPSNRLLS